MENQREIIEEFLVESNETLAQLDQDFVALEERPDDQDLLAGVFRAIHTIKGVSGFMGFSTLGAVAHRVESLLSQLRDGERRLTPELTDLLLRSFDAIRGILAEIERTSEEGPDDCGDLIETLERAGEDGGTPAPTGLPAPDTPHREPGAPAGRHSIAESSIRVNVETLDDLMNLVGELVLARNQILQYASSRDDGAFLARSQRLNMITTELQAKVMKTRMQPIRVVWKQFPRFVRDLGHAFGKQIDLTMEGADTELDRTVVEAIKDPLTHIVRNSCDHGIEPASERTAAGKPAKGRLSLKAFHEGGQVNIEISDDGAGIDIERVKEKALAKGLVSADRAEKMSEQELANLVFLPGFSTARRITDVSGRGVGMDVVQAHIEKIGGTIDLQNRRGQGTTIRIKIPLTLAIIPALIVLCAGERFAVPQANLLELVRAEPGAERQIEWIHDAPVYRLRDRLLPLLYLHDAIQLEREEQRNDQAVNIVVLQADDKQFGLIVDDVCDTAEIVVKPLSKLLKGLSCFAGATVMGDGRISLILDVMGLAHARGVLSESGGGTLTEAEASEAEAGSPILLFRCGERRLAAPVALVDRLEDCLSGRIETAGVRKVMQYRGGILPLISLEPGADNGEAAPPQGDQPQVIVFREGRTRFGIVVDEVLDIRQAALAIRSQVRSPGLVGSAVVDGRITDFIDVRYFSNRARRGGDGGGVEEAAGAQVLLADPSPFARGLLRWELEMAGHGVSEAKDVGEAMERLSERKTDLVLSSMDLEAPGPYQLLRRIRENSQLGALPILGLTESDAAPAPADGPSFDELHDKGDVDGVLDAIRRLAGVGSQAEATEVRS